MNAAKLSNASNVHRLPTKKQKEAPPVTYSERNIVTTYYTDADQRFTVRVNRAKYPRMAVQRAVDNITMGTYSTTTHMALLAVVYDENTGAHHATIRLHVDGSINIYYHRNPREESIAGDSKNPFGVFKAGLSRTQLKKEKKPKKSRK